MQEQQSPRGQLNQMETEDFLWWSGAVDLILGQSTSSYQILNSKKPLGGGLKSFGVFKKVSVDDKMTYFFLLF